MYKQITILIASLIILLIIIVLQQQQKAVKQFPSQNYSEIIQTVEPSPLIDPQPSPTIISHGLRDNKEVALTFDADMTPNMKQMLISGRVKSWYNSKVIDILNQTHTPATMFLTGMWIETYPAITQQLANNPLFQLANHSYDHPSFGGACYGLSKVTIGKEKEEVEKTQILLKTVAGVDNKYFRFPGGCSTKENVSLVRGMGLRIVNWDDIGGDSFLKNRIDIAKKTIQNVSDGSIIVLHMHDPEQKVAGNTAGALPIIIETLKKQGYTFVTVAKLVETPKQMVQVLPKLQPKSYLFAKKATSPKLFPQLF